MPSPHQVPPESQGKVERRWTLYQQPFKTPLEVVAGPCLPTGHSIEVMPVEDHESAIGELVEELDRRIADENSEMPEFYWRSTAFKEAADLLRKARASKETSHG